MPSDTTTKPGPGAHSPEKVRSPTAVLNTFTGEGRGGGGAKGKGKEAD